MLTSKRFSSLPFGAVFVSLVLVTGLFSFGQIRVSARTWHTILTRTAEIDSARNQEPPTEEREFEDAIPKHVPIKVKIKAEKEKAFKDLANEHWVRDMVIEVKNTGAKPIYFLDLALDLPDTLGPDGNLIGFSLLYGRTALVEVTAPLKPNDVPINPGEIHDFTIAERFVTGWEGIAHEFHIAQPKKVRVLLQFINFGDGTGLWRTDGAPLPHPKTSATKELQPISISELRAVRFQRAEEILAAQQEKQERTFKLRDFKDNPLTVRQVKNLESDTWHTDLAIEVKNISTKPIYSIIAYLEFPEHKAPGNHDTGIILRFGERKYIDIRVMGDPQDQHLDPGDKYVFTIPPQYRKGLKIQHEKAADEFKRLELHFGLISFGDATGFEAGDPTDYRGLSIKHSIQGNQRHHANTLSSSGVRSPPQDGCGSCGRYILSPESSHVCFNAYQNEWCDSDLVTTASWAKCRRTSTRLGL